MEWHGAQLNPVYSETACLDSNGIYR